ncbi:hypothetical protein [Glutamicibacter sp. TV12E]|uniref:hypothetical protein n=1 Tax=Glutamicibacter sp. TV12E TaxID=3446362 RepID=UPI00403479B1
MILWGQVHHARGYFLDTVYVNEKKPAVRLQKEVLAGLLQAKNLSGISDFSGWYFIVEGRFQENVKGAPYMALDNAQKIAFLPPQNSTSDQQGGPWKSHA